MSGYTLSNAAKGELRAIYKYIARDNPAAAKRFDRKLHGKFKLLGQYPLLGEVRSDLSGHGAEVRTFTCDAYVIYYRVAEGPVEIAHVARGDRNPTNIF